MSREAILAAIEASGEAELAQLRAETAAHAGKILAEAERAALERRGSARRRALLPAAGQRARRLHRARLEALCALGEVRDCLVETALSRTRDRLASLRADPEYPVILRRLTEEAIRVLGDEGPGGYRGQVEVDPRDEPILLRLPGRLGLDLDVKPALECWGGLVARSGDGKIVATNTLEARLERATPFLRRELAAFFEKELQELKEIEEMQVPSAPSLP